MMKNIFENLRVASGILRSLVYGKDGDMASVALGLLMESMAELKSPQWETPKQREKRTGKVWPDNAAVYWRMRDDKKSKWYKWFPMPLEMAEMAIAKTIGEHQLICATEAGPPPDDWEPEEGMS
jgi:hypothetical protein